jgi:hypothetical protein
MSAQIGRKRMTLWYVLSGLAILSITFLWTAASQAASNQGDKEAGAGALPAAPAWSPDCWFQATNPFTFTNLLGVDMLSSSEAWAVGQRGGSSGAGFVAKWDGTAWSQDYTAPSPSALYAISALSSTNAWAVGYDDSLTGSAIRWDGTGWTPVVVPAPTSSSRLQDVALIEADTAWAVGSYTSGNSNYPLIEHWDGAAWTMWPITNTGALYGIFAVAHDDIWAVGDQDLSSPLVMHWDGAAWSVWPLPPIIGDDSVFNSISGTSATDIWAVGSATVIPGYSIPLIMHWDGSEWTAVTTAPDAPSAVPLPDYSWLTSVVALSPTDAWVAGGRVYSAFLEPIIMRWDGANWQPASAQLFPRSHVQSVDAISSAEAFAVGRDYGPGGSYALTLRFEEGPCPTPTPTPTPTACSLTFSDVRPGSTFYPFVQCLACREIVSGYPDNTFRPSNPVTRGQLSKIVSNSAGFNDPPGAQIFEDVPPGSTFYEWVQRLASRGYMSGYPCGGVGEPCGSANLSYFRPNSGATRGQAAKIISNAAGFTDVIWPEWYTFADVPPASAFWVYIQRLVNNRPFAIQGYPCGGPGEPCDPMNRAYFRPGNPLTRGQASKIVASTFFPYCEVPWPGTHRTSLLPAHHARPLYGQ